MVGLDGEPYWLITLEEPDGAALAGYALRAECTHLGCLADWRPGLELLINILQYTHAGALCALSCAVLSGVVILCITLHIIILRVCVCVCVCCVCVHQAQGNTSALVTVLNMIRLGR